MHTLEADLVNLKDAKGRVPLHAAAWSDSSDCLQTLLDRDADVNAVDLSGQTPVILAAQRGHQMLLGTLNAFLPIIK